MMLKATNVYFWIILVPRWNLISVSIAQNFDRSGENGVNLYAREGSMINFKCSSRYNFANYYVGWYRLSGYTGNETLMYRDGMLMTSNMGEESMAYSLQSNSEYEMTISITRGLGQWLNKNEYRCEVKQRNNDMVKFETENGNIVLWVEYPPPPIYPLCSTMNYHDSIGKNVTIQCYSQPGYPLFSLQLLRNNVVVDNKTIRFTTDIWFKEVSLDYSFAGETEDLEAVYQCKVIWYQYFSICTIQQTIQDTTAQTTTNKSTSVQSKQETTPQIRNKEDSTKSNTTIFYFIIGVAVVVCITIGVVILFCRRKHQSVNELHTNQTGIGNVSIENEYYNHNMMNEHTFGGNNNESKKGLRKQSNAVNENREESSFNRNTGLRYSHKMVENETYASLDDDVMSFAKKQREEKEGNFDSKGIENIERKESSLYSKVRKKTEG